MVAVEIHPAGPTVPRIEFDLELLGTGYIAPPPSLSLVPTATNLWLSWPATNSAGFTLYSAPGVENAGAWSPVTGAVQTNGALLSLPVSPGDQQRYFRLQRP